MHKSYAVVQYPECKGMVYENWLVRHLKSGCKIGADINDPAVRAAWPGRFADAHAHPIATGIQPTMEK